MHRYRGWRCPKLHLALITMAVICVAYFAIGAPQGAFGEFTMALLGAAGIYSTSAVVDRFASRDQHEGPPA